jgi:hypothetical protein
MGSRFNFSVIAGVKEQAQYAELQNLELARLQWQ